MHRHLRHFAALALLALLLAAPGLALAHGEGPQQTVDDYTVTLALPEKGFFTGRNPVAVSLWDWQGNTPETTVSVLLLAFTPAGDGHGDTHGEAAPTDDHAAADDPAAADDHTAAVDHGEAAAAGHSDVAAGHTAAAEHSDATATADDAASNDHAPAASEHDHASTSATEGQGLVAAPVALAPSDELGEYRGELAFDQVGTYTVSVVFTVDGEEHGAIFDVAVAQSRPRGLVLGGFALVNALAIGAAGVLKWRGPRKPAAKHVHPVPATTSTTEE